MLGIAKKQQDSERLTKSIEELEHLDIEVELEAHEKLQNWSEQSNAILVLIKKKAHQSALLRATKSCRKSRKRHPELEDAVCYTCGQALHEDKKAEIAERKQKELERCNGVIRRNK